MVTTDPQERTLQHLPARYGTSVANQRGMVAKEATYVGVLRAHRTMRLCPVAIETFVALGEDFQRFIRNAARHQGRCLSLSHDALPHLNYSMVQRITVAFMHTPVLTHTLLISTAGDLVYVARAAGGAREKGGECAAGGGRRAGSGYWR